MTAPSEAEDRRIPLATIRLSMLERSRQVAVHVPTGPSRLLDLLPAANAIANATTEILSDHVRAEGKEFSCKAGCGACCRQLVGLPIVEAQALAELVAAMPPERQAIIRSRFAQAVKRLEETGFLDPNEPRGHRGLIAPDRGDWEATRSELASRYFDLGIPCPFLEDESCSIHPDRPTVCRGYHVTSPPERCANLYREPVDAFQPPFRLGDVLAALTTRIHGIERPAVVLVLSLEWSEANAQQLAATRDGRELFLAFMEEFGAEAERS